MAVTQGLGDGFALYNGVELPDINEVWTDKVTYPYAFLAKQGTYTFLFICATQVSMSIISSTNPYSHITKVGGNWKWWCIPDDSSITWASASSKSGKSSNGQTIFSATEPTIWANHDVINSDGTLYLSASSPIPLDGMQVIEWDGDTTGLDGLELSEIITAYRVADYTYASNAVCVATHSEGYNEVFDGFGSSDTGWNVGAWALGVKDYGIRISTVEGWNDENSISYVSLLAYTPAAEPETPKWQFNLSDFLSGIAAAAASRGVLRRTPIAYLYNGVQLPGLPEWDETVYPYCYIIGLDTRYLVLSATAKTANSNGYVSVGSNDENQIVFVLQDEAWVTFNSSVTYRTLIWCSEDVYYASGEILMEASEPVPIYK